jgi:hypothetical protein
MVPGQVRAGFWHQRGEAGNKVLGLKDHVRGAVAIRRYSDENPDVIGETLPGNGGNVRNIEISNVEIVNGKPTSKSLEKVYAELSEKAGTKNGVSYPVDPTFFEGYDFEKMNEAALGIANNPDRKEYSPLLNNCYDFADNVIEAGADDNN